MQFPIQSIKSYLLSHRKAKVQKANQDVPPIPKQNIPIGDLFANRTHITPMNIIVKKLYSLLSSLFYTQIKLFPDMRLFYHK